MIGNDIVDVNFSRKESNWKRNGFLEKIFTAEEIAIILHSKNQEFTVWNLWTRKEAAYKIYVQETQITGYFPSKICCHFECETNGFVLINSKKYYTKTEINTNYIHTIAVKKILDFDEIIVVKNRNNLIKKNGIPYYNEIQNNKIFPVSISNHGLFETIVMLNKATNQVEI